MSAATYLVFGDLHGRVLPAFRLALAWGREHGERLDGLLQVGDLGFFPDPARLDKATLRHAKDDPLELGARYIVQPGKLADAILNNVEVPPLWFVPGNHEDYVALDERKAAGGKTDFPVDAYLCVRCLRDGTVTRLPGGLRVGGLWGIDDQAPNARRRVPAEARIRPRSANQLAGQAFDVLLTHESPRDAVRPGCGSEEIDLVLHLARPAFAFFGHYGARRPALHVSCERTQVFHIGDMEMHGPGGSAEEGSVGLLRWDDGGGRFEYLDPAWLRTFTRHNWK